MSFTQALHLLMPLQALAAALVFAALVGWRGAHAGGRWAQAGLAALALGLALLNPALGLPRTAHTLGWAAVSAGVSALWWALSRWSVPQAGRQAMAAAPLAVAAAHAALGANPALAQALVDAGLAAQLAWLAVLLARPAAARQGPHHRRWRLLGLAGVLPLLAALAWKALAEDPAWGPADAAAPARLALALADQFALLLVMPVLLLAWRAQTEAELARLAQTDGLTGLSDSRAFAERSVALIAMARRFDEPLALMVFEPDGFAALRAERGDGAADRALALFGACVQAQMRLGDLAGRLDDMRFGVLMARCLPEGPIALDARLRATLDARAAAELGQPLGFNAGWARLRPGDRSLADLQRRADTALYEARRAGGGRLMAEPGVAD